MNCRNPKNKEAKNHSVYYTYIYKWIYLKIFTTCIYVLNIDFYIYMSGRVYIRKDRETLKTENTKITQIIARKIE